MPRLTLCPQTSAPQRTPLRRAFTHADTAAAALTLAVLFALLLVMLPRHRAMGQLSGSLANLRELGSAVQSYGLDNADRVATFSWRKGDTSSQWADLRNPTDDVAAAACQAVDIIRRRKPYSPSKFPKISGWIPHPYFTHLALLDYLSTTAPWPKLISPGDVDLLKWAANPDALPFDLGTRPNRRDAFQSSYEMAWTFWYSPESGPDAPWQSTHAGFASFNPTRIEVGKRLLSEVTFPSEKALWYEKYQRFFGPRIAFFMYDEAQVPVCAADGSVAVRGGSSTNDGWDPHAPSSTNVLQVTYLPDTRWEPPVLPGISAVLKGGMRWTRHGLGGRDFDGPEVPFP